MPATHLSLRRRHLLPVRPTATATHWLAARARRERAEVREHRLRQLLNSRVGPAGLRQPGRLDRGHRLVFEPHPTHELPPRRRIGIPSAAAAAPG